MIRLLAIGMQKESEWEGKVAAYTLARQKFPKELRQKIYRELSSDERFQRMSLVEGIDQRARRRAFEHIQNRYLRRTEDSRYSALYGPGRHSSLL
jgi:hypothetical protein